jgi:hypothetical protein
VRVAVTKTYSSESLLTYLRCNYTHSCNGHLLNFNCPHQHHQPIADSYHHHVRRSDSKRSSIRVRCMRDTSLPVKGHHHDREPTLTPPPLDSRADDSSPQILSGAMGKSLLVRNPSVPLLAPQPHFRPLTEPFLPLAHSRTNIGFSSGEKQIRLTTGMHVTRDIECLTCRKPLGWYYVSPRSLSPN